MNKPHIRSLLRPRTDATRPGRQPFHGWRMVWLVGLVVFFAAPGMTYGNAAFVDPLTLELSISRSLFTLAYAVATLFSAIVLLAIGKQLDQWGSRLAMALSTVGLAIGVVWLSFSTGPLWLFIGFALTRTFGQGIMPLAARVLIPHWFLRQRGRAFSVLGIAGTLSIATIPPVHEWLIGHFGWRIAWRLDAAWLLVFLVPVIVFFVRDRPEDVGQFPDGVVPDPDLPSAHSDADAGMTLREAMHTRSFWALVAVSGVGMGITSGLALNQVAIFVDLGYPGSLAALTFTVESIAMFGATILVGAWVDRVSLRYSLVFSQVVLIAAMAVLLLATSFWMGVVYAALRGACMAVVMVATDVAWPAYFGRRHLGSIRGAGAAVGVFGTALGPLPMGIAFDRLGSYAPAIGAMVLLPVLAGILMLASRPPVVSSLPVMEPELTTA